MVLNPFLEQRKRMKQLLLEMLQKNKNLSVEQILAIFSLKTGVRIKTAKEYLEELKILLESREKREKQQKLSELK